MKNERLTPQELENLKKETLTQQEMLDMFNIVMTDTQEVEDIERAIKELKQRKKILNN